MPSLTDKQADVAVDVKWKHKATSTKLELKASLARYCGEAGGCRRVRVAGEEGIAKQCDLVSKPHHWNLDKSVSIH